jgi:ketosteroid isomerase-like protein
MFETVLFDAMTATTTTPSSTSPIATVVGLYAALAAGDLDAAGGHLTTDVVLHVPGLQPLSGDHVGRQAVVDFVVASSTTAGRSEEVEVLEVLAGEHHVAAICRVTGRRDGHVALDNRTVHLFRLDGDAVAEIWFHNWDQPAVDAFWS